jgi:hypothetical protein
VPFITLEINDLGQERKERTGPHGIAENSKSLPPPLECLPHLASGEYYLALGRVEFSPGAQRQIAERETTYPHTDET